MYEMKNSKIYEPLFNIDFTKWMLLKNPKTGAFIDPVSSDDFETYRYWRNQFGTPIRQIICKKTAPLYADYLHLDTATLQRKVSSMLGFSPYDDEINKEAYEILCQTVLLKHHYTKQINYEVLLPFQTLALTFLRFQEKVVIRKLQELYEVNLKTKTLEKTTLATEIVLEQFHEISEYDFYYVVIQELIQKEGFEFLNPYS